MADITFSAANTAGLNNPGTEIIALVKDGSGNFINPPSYDKMRAYLRSGEVPMLFVTDEAGETGDIYQFSGYSETENKIRFTGEKTAIEFIAGADVPVETEIWGGRTEKNLFSFENADNSIAWLSKNKPETNYILEQSPAHGYKDTDKNYFVFLSPEDRNYGITGGLDNPLPVGSYKLSAELFIPSGNTSRTTVRFGTWVAPSVYASYSDFDIGAQDTWVPVEIVFAVSEGDTVNYICAKSYIDKFPFYVRNIKVISLAPDLEGWEGKKWAAVGDSLTEKNGKALKQYHDYIAENTGISVVNMGVSGTGYKQYADTNNAFYQRILNVPTDTDVVTIFGSGNDLSHPLGNVTDTGTDTICGCINKTIDNLYSVLPTVQLGIITPTPWGEFNPENDSNAMAQYSAKIVEICRLRGIPCLDLYHCSSMRPWDDTFCSLAYNTNSAGDGYDRVHPNSTGHAIFAPRIKAFLQSLLL